MKGVQPQKMLNRGDLHGYESAQKGGGGSGPPGSVRCLNGKPAHYACLCIQGW